MKQKPYKPLRVSPSHWQTTPFRYATLKKILENHSYQVTDDSKQMFSARRAMFLATMMDEFWNKTGM